MARRPQQWQRILLACSLMVFGLLGVGVPQPVQAAIFDIANGDVAGLVAAINTANASNGPDTIFLAPAGLYLLTQAAHSDSLGPTGLPVITSQITIEGNGATIQRSSADGIPAFRILRIDAGGNLILRRVTVSGGRATATPALGGGIMTRPNSVVTLDQSIVTGNWSDFIGGGITNDGLLTIQGGSIFNNNTAVDGGAIFNGSPGELHMSDSTLRDNLADFGGGIFNDNGGVIAITNSRIRNNVGHRWGGGIVSVSFGGGADAGTVLTINDSTLADNSAGEGGGIYHNTGQATITSSTFHNNQAGIDGGGLASPNPLGTMAQLAVTNSTFSGNHAHQRGGALYAVGIPTVRFSTLVGNSATTGGGIYSTQRQLKLASTIVAQNSPSDCVGTAITSQGYNLDSDGSCQLTGAGDLTKADPLLAPLADNGGPAYTHALLPASPALDRTPLAANGCNGAITADQRGTRRPQGPACDSGAFELSANVLVNPGFESGLLPWRFATNGRGSLSNDSPGYKGVASARIDIATPGTNVLFYQRGFTLQPKTRYLLQFVAKSSTGHDLSVYLQRDSGAFVNYGVNNFRVNLTSSWKKFTIEFTTRGFSTPTTDTRLRFWLAPFDAARDSYWFDQVSLAKVAPGAVTAAASPVVGQVTGQVQSSRAPVVATLVDLDTGGEQFQATLSSDATGMFDFANVPQGSYELRITPPQGYLAPEPVQLAVTEEPDETLLFPLELIASTIFLPEVSR